MPSHSGKPLPPSDRLIPNEPIREAVERSDVSLSQIARELGWMKPDTERLKVYLGMKEQKDPKRGVPIRRQRTDYDLVCEIARIIGADPVDAGV